MTEESIRFVKEEARRLSEENRELREELRALRESVHALSALYYLSQNISSETDALKLLGNILDSSMAVLKASDGTLMLLDEVTGELVFTVVRGAAAASLTGYRLPSGQGIAGAVAAQKRPEIVLDVRRDSRFFSLVDETVGFKTRSMVCVPITLDNGRVLGVIQILNKVSDRQFTQDDLDLMLVVAQLAATAIRRAERAGGPSALSASL
jgi:GAF domain-containing protein